MPVSPDPRSRDDAPGTLRRAADVLRTVAHPVRLRVIEMLRDGERTVTDLYQEAETRQDAMSRHLTLMRDRGVLTSRREGPHILYALANPDLVKIIECVRSHCRAASPPHDDGGE